MTDYANSVGPISVIGKLRVGQANSVGPIAHFGETETLRRETERLQPHLGVTEIPRQIGLTDRDLSLTEMGL